MNVTIVDDFVVNEPIDSLSVTLERTPGLDIRITLDPVDELVEIDDIMTVRSSVYNYKQLVHDYIYLPSLYYCWV